MPSAEELHTALKEYELLKPQPVLKIFLKKRFPGLTRKELQKLLAEQVRSAH